MNTHVIKSRSRRGFTIVELMITLVVAGLIMSVLVGISGSVQRSFGRSKDITDLQANLRFAMKTVTDDMARAAFMTSADANLDTPHKPQMGGNLPSAAMPAIAYTDGPPRTLTLRGNYVSSRDYRVDPSNGRILCRNGMIWDAVQECKVPGVFYDPADPDWDKQDQPFLDGPTFVQVFAANRDVRIDVGGNRFTYHKVIGANSGSYQVTFQPALDRNIAGDELRSWWVSPVTWVDYEFSCSGAEAADSNWKLRRIWNETDALGAPQPTSMELVDFLLPACDLAAEPGGFEIGVVNDANAPPIGTATPWMPSVTDPGGRLDVPVPVTCGIAGAVDPATARAMVITLRGRTQAEDAAFVLGTYGADPLTRNFGFDLDGVPSNGLAFVRVEHTVVELRNLSMNRAL